MANPFHRGAKRYAELLARWDSRHEQWTFQKRFNEPADPEAGRSFEEAVRIAFGLLRNSRNADIREFTSTLQPPYHVWLDLMRNQKRGFRRREQIRSLHMHASIACMEEGIPLPPSATILLENGDIQDVFEQSARLWDDLVVREADGGFPKANQAGVAEPSGDESTRTQSGPAEPEPTTAGRKRGRPQTIPDERKVRAAALKASGGTNSAVAAVLYAKRFPTPQEVKNVPSHLRAFSKKLKRPGSSAQTSPRSPGIKG